MKAYGWLILALGVAGMLSAEPTPYDGVAAYVNDKVITIDSVMQQIRRGVDFSKIPSWEREAKVRELYPKVRDWMVERMLILDAYERSGGQLPADTVTRRIQSIIADHFGGDEARLTEELRRNQMTKAEWTKQERENIIVDAMRHLQVNQKTTVSPRRVKEYFAEHMADFAENSGVRIRSISLSPAQSGADLEKVLAELAAGKPFAEVAAQYSSDPQATEGGDWGVIKPEEVFSKAVVDAIKQLKVGAHSEPLALPGGYQVIVQKVSEQKGKMPTLAEVWADVEEAVLIQAREARYDAWVAELRKAAVIRQKDLPELSE